MSMQHRTRWWERIRAFVTMCWIMTWDWLTPWGALPIPQRVDRGFSPGARPRH